MKVPEVLAPAGDEAAMDAALANGADAVYFGLSGGFNARARAKNFELEDLPETMAKLHRVGARGYVTFNTLVFENELESVRSLLQSLETAKVDALIVQDPAVCLLAAEIAPALEVHASTQMTVSSAGGARVAESLGVTRFVAPRELSLDEIRLLSTKTTVPIEVFIHGALCVSWSGQCLTSEAWGGRSANRGQCAQSCRMPYDLVVDGEVRKTAFDAKYLLSPKDLLGVRALEELAEIGVASVKIEGRQKDAEYVATAVGSYRRWLDRIANGNTLDNGDVENDLRKLALTYSRGFSDGFLGGSDHQTLVEGRFPKHRGILLGKVISVAAGQRTVTVERQERPWTGGNVLRNERTRAQGEKRKLRVLTDETLTNVPLSPRAGMGIVFDEGRPEENEQGGPIFAVEESGSRITLRFGQPGPDLSRVRVGQLVWVTSDPTIAKDVRKAARAKEEIDLFVQGDVGSTLEVTARGKSGEAVRVTSSSLLALANTGGLGETILREKLGSLGDAPYVLRALDTSTLAEGLFLPVSELKQIRRELAEALSARAPKADRDSRPSLAVTRAMKPVEPLERAPSVTPLCRTMAQVEAAIEVGVEQIELDWMEMVGLSKAVARVREAGRRVVLATMRIEKPGEEPLTERIASLGPDSILVRHWGGVDRFAGRSDAKLIGDFSLNVTNSVTANWLLSKGMEQLTASFDLDEEQLTALVGNVPRGRVAVVVHHRIPTFHTEHCVYAHTLSEGRDFNTCGRPCEKHELSLRDHLGKAHPVIVDAGCRNTVFNAEPQSIARIVPKLLSLGVWNYRVDLVRETNSETKELLLAYRALVTGKAEAKATLRGLGARDQIGVLGVRA